MPQNLTHAPNFRGLRCLMWPIARMTGTPHRLHPALCVNVCRSCCSKSLTARLSTHESVASVAASSFALMQAGAASQHIKASDVHGCCECCL